MTKDRGLRIRAALGALLLLFLFVGLAHSAAPNRIRRRIGGNSYPNIAAQFVAASSQNFSIASNSTLQAGAGNLSVAAWVWVDSLSVPNVIISKLSGVSPYEYILDIDSNGGSNQFQFLASTQTSGGGAGGLVHCFASSFGAVPLSTWNFVVAWSDGSNLNIQVNNGTVNSVAFAGAIFSGTRPFTLGSDAVPSSFLNGRIDSAGIWKQALSAGDRARLYNGGVGLAYKDLSGSLLTSLTGWWNLDGNALDASGTGNNPTNNNGVTFVAGKR